jgi:Predicted integral membrane protein (DUF2269)
MLALKLLHVALAFAFVAGLVGRWLLLRRAARAAQIETAYLLSEAAGPFEKLVIWGSMAVPLAGLLTAAVQGYPWLGLTTGWMLVSFLLLLTTIPVIPLVFIPRGQAFAAEMQAARAAGGVTPGLQAAFRDRPVAAARTYEAAVVAVIVALMVLKPF